ncbi:hypothetical protein cypCar_00002655 [Cyprinus carpio]|nr:hypothetical protein cypCar_00002655 [Cyprinus carpio]
MTQWERLQQLDTVYSQRAFDLYNRDEFPMEVRHYLAHWIEGQDWERASRDSSQAAFLFQVLLENLDNQFSRFAQERDSFLLQRNFRRYKQNFQKYQEEPYTLANIIHWFLVKEREILNDAELAQQVSTLKYHHHHHFFYQHHHQHLLIHSQCLRCRHCRFSQRQWSWRARDK